MRASQELLACNLCDLNGNRLNTHASSSSSCHSAMILTRMSRHGRTSPCFRPAFVFQSCAGRGAQPVVPCKDWAAVTHPLVPWHSGAQRYCKAERRQFSSALWLGALLNGLKKAADRERHVRFAQHILRAMPWSIVLAMRRPFSLAFGKELLGLYVQCGAKLDGADQLRFSAQSSYPATKSMLLLTLDGSVQ